MQPTNCPDISSQALGKAMNKGSQIRGAAASPQCLFPHKEILVDQSSMNMEDETSNVLKLIDGDRPPQEEDTLNSAYDGCAFTIDAESENGPDNQTIDPLISDSDIQLDEEIQNLLDAILTGPSPTFPLSDSSLGTQLDTVNTDLSEYKNILGSLHEFSSIHSPSSVIEYSQNKMELPTKCQDLHPVLAKNELCTPPPPELQNLDKSSVARPRNHNASSISIAEPPNLRSSSTAQRQNVWPVIAVTPNASPQPVSEPHYHPSSVSQGQPRFLNALPLVAIAPRNIHTSSATQPHNFSVETANRHAFLFSQEQPLTPNDYSISFPDQYDFPPSSFSKPYNLHASSVFEQGNRVLSRIDNDFIAKSFEANHGEKVIVFPTKIIVPLKIDHASNSSPPTNSDLAINYSISVSPPETAQSSRSSLTISDRDINDSTSASLPETPRPKRGSKRPLRFEDFQSSPSIEEDGQLNSSKQLSEAEKFRRMRRINNVASKKCREKKKMKLKLVEKEIKIEKTNNRTLINNLKEWEEKRIMWGELVQTILCHFKKNILQ